jgi:hypothetical protein
MTVKKLAQAWLLLLSALAIVGGLGFLSYLIVRFAALSGPLAEGTNANGSTHYHYHQGWGWGPASLYFVLLLVTIIASFIVLTPE